MKYLIILIVEGNSWLRDFIAAGLPSAIAVAFILFIKHLFDRNKPKKVEKSQETIDKEKAKGDKLKAEGAIMDKKAQKLIPYIIGLILFMLAFAFLFKK